MKLFATDVTQKHIYGILFVVLSIILYPHLYISVLSYFIFTSMVISLWGHILGSEKTVIVGSTVAFICSAAIGIGLVSNNWEWLFNGYKSD